MAPQHVLQLPLELGPAEHAINQVRPIERSDQLDRIAQRELRRDVAAYARSRGCGVRVKADAGKHLAQPRQLPVLRTEVVSPLADAVRLVHRNEADVRSAELREERLAALAGQPLRRHVEQAVPPVANPAEDRRALVRRQRAVEAGGRHAIRGEPVHLILHQRDQRRDHEGQARVHEGRGLKTE